MSGPRRLAVVLTGVWLAAWYGMYSLDLNPSFQWDGFFLLAVSPAALAWAAWWVWRGFAGRQNTSN
jgi:hypothetical protein